MKALKFLLIGIFIVAFSLQAYAGDSRSGKETTNASGSTDEYPLLKYHLGDTIYYTMFMENTDIYPLVIEEISDVFSDLSPLTVDPPLGPGDTDDITLAPGDPGETQYFATEVEVTEGALYFDGMYWRVLNTANFIAYTQYPTVNDPSNKTETKSSIILHPDICVTKTVEPTISKVGSTVTYTIEICNCGDTELTLTELSDTLLPIDLANVPAEGLVLDGALLDESGNIIPDSGECTSFTYEYTIKEGDPVLLVNEVCVTGEDEIGGPRGTVTDCDVAVVELISPELTILKTVDFNGDGVYGDLETYYSGAPASWKIVVSNPSDYAVSDIYVTDDNGTNYGPFNLAAGTSQDVPLYTTNPTSDFENEACAEGIDELDGTVGPVCDTAAVHVIGPALSIAKTVDFDGDGVYGDLETYYSGAPASWKIVVSNPSDYAVSDIYVTDDNGTNYGPFNLAAGTSQDVPLYTTNPTADFENEACAEGIDELGGTVGPVCDTAAVHVIGPALSIAKTVDFDGDGVYGDLETYYSGAPASWKIVVSNPSDYAVSDIYVTDDNGTNYGPFNLAAGTSQDVPLYTTNPTADFENEACAEGVDELGGTVGPVCDTAAVEIIVENPGTTIDIKANGSDGPITVCEGDEVILTICEDNSGDVVLTGVYVELSENGALTGETLASPPDSGDSDGDGELDTDETWCWNVPVIVDTTTAYDAIGHGIDPSGNDITPPIYPLEYDEVTVETEPCGGEGCTPGFWKNNGDKHGASAWCERFDPGDLFSMHFSLNEPLVIRGKGRSTITNPTLLQALNANGGGVNAMIRHGIAAMLNACSDCVQYEYSSEDQVIMMIEDALNGVGGYTVGELHSMFAEANEAGCPVNQHGQCVGVEED